MTTARNTDMTYRISNESLPLDHLRVNVEVEVAGAHQTMREGLRTLLDAKMRALDLMQGRGEFAEAWAQPEMVLDADGNPTDQQAPYDPGQAAPLVDAICMAMRANQMTSAAWPADEIRYCVERLRELDPEHPCVANWAVLRDACTPQGWTPADWFPAD